MTPGTRLRSVESQLPNLFKRRLCFALLVAGQVEGFPSHQALLFEYRPGTEGVTTVQWNGMVKDMQNTHTSIYPEQVTMWRVSWIKPGSIRSRRPIISGRIRTGFRSAASYMLFIPHMALIQGRI